LRQVLTNLVGNGVKFTEIGEVVLRVDLLKRADDIAELLIKVSDTGIGLSDVARKRLFNPFTQADGSTTRKYGGTGLGLAISRRLVELMGGEIGVKSVEGVGSTFWFTSILKVNVLDEAASTRKSPDLTSTRVLILDGNPAQRRLMSHFIRSWGGVEPDSAWDNATALEMLQDSSENGNKGYQLIIYDLNSPNLTLEEIMKAISTLAKKEQPCFIYLAGYDQRELVESLCGDCKSAYLIKPVRQSAIFDLLVSVCEQTDSPFDQGQVLTVNQDIPENLSMPESLQPVGAGLVLLAEDNPANQRLALVQLKRLGYQTELASNGGQALSYYLASPGKYTLILMDCQMPVMDGFDATRRIREFEQKSGGHIPIVAMTANAMQGDREACLDAGMDDYVSKPVSLESLRQALNRMKESVYNQKSNARSPEVVRTDYQPLDINVLIGLRELQEEGEPDFLTELIDIYLEDSAQLVEEIRLAVEAQESARIRNAAHTLKGSSGNLGANAFSRICYEMELAARGGDIEAARNLLPALLGEYKVVGVHLSQERKVEN
jgi:two-component system sensor histidine kinase/response regulator